MNTGGFGSDPADELVTGVNITPIVDVALVLLIVFLVTASGVSALGIGSAFWGLAAGLAYRAFSRAVAARR